MNNNNSFLGTGWAFPVTFRKGQNGQNCAVDMVTEVEDIRESLTILFSTNLGERVMRPNYGSALQDMIFEPINESLITYIKDLINNAILYYEARIEVENIEINTEEELEGRIKIELIFSVRTTNSRFNYVFDFYKREGTIAPI